MLERLTLPNPYHQMERKANPDLAQPLRARDQVILTAYEDIVMSIRRLQYKNPIRVNQQSIDYSHPFQLAGKPFIKDFICPFCAVSLNLVDDQYIIILQIDQRGLNRGTGIESNALIRLAFMHTMNGKSNFNIENALEITMVDNAEEYFKRRETIYESERIDWFSK